MRWRVVSLFIVVLLSHALKAIEYKVDYVVDGQCHESLKEKKIVADNPQQLKNKVVSLFDLSQVDSVDFFMQQALVKVVVKCAAYIDDVDISTQGVSRDIVEDNLGVKSGFWIKKNLLIQKKSELYALLQGLGYREIKIDFNIVPQQENSLLKVAVTAHPSPRVARVVFSNRLLEQQLKLRGVVGAFVGKSYSKNIALSLINLLKKHFRNQGIYYVRIPKHRVVPLGKDQVVLHVDLELGKQQAINISSSVAALNQELKDLVRNRIFMNSKKVSVLKISTFLKKELKRHGYYDASINIRKQSGRTIWGYAYDYYFVNIKLGYRIKITDVEFIGLKADKKRRAVDLFWKQGNDLIKSRYFDEDYVNDYVGFLKKELLGVGALYVKINKPVLLFNEERTKVKIQYTIQLGSTFLLAKFSTNSDLVNKLMDQLKLYNRVNRPFNPLKLKDDLQNILSSVVEQGYFFARYQTISPEKIITYDLTNNRVVVKLNIINLTKTKISDYVLLGNKKTEAWVVERLLNIHSGTILTPMRLADYKSQLLKAGLFSTVEIQTLYDKSIEGVDYYRLIIKLKERKAGRIIWSLGYRTDLGIKFDTKVDYGNLAGEAKTVGADIRLNQRLNNALDQIRPSATNNLIEYNVGLRYNDPFLFKSQFQFNSKLGVIRERYYSFDAKILRLATNIQRDLGKHFSLSLRYQIEKVEQYNADEEINEASFRIAGITPKLTIDYRNSRTIPSKGFKIDISWEFANPYFGAMNQDDLVINFNKLIWRNAIYFPVSFGTIAILVAAGAQKNFATKPLFNKEGDPVYWQDGTRRLEGYIPSIRVFRLEGGYNIRGYSFDESNILLDGSDISTKVVQDSAYFSLIKVEPRYFYSDNIIMSLFFDGGRIFYNTFQPLKLRTSVGLSFKYVTPIGTIDLDYGVKLDRIVDSERREKFGSIHFSIGLF